MLTSLGVSCFYIRQATTKVADLASQLAFFVLFYQYVAAFKILVIQFWLCRAVLIYCGVQGSHSLAANVKHQYRGACPWHCAR